MKHEEKRFHCDICDKSWAKEKNLIMHNEIKHEGLRYDCDDCDFQSVSWKSLRSHKNYIHGGIGVDCDICENKYSNTWTLKKNTKLRFTGCQKIFERTRLDKWQIIFCTHLLLFFTDVGYI